MTTTVMWTWSLVIDLLISLRNEKAFIQHFLEILKYEYMGSGVIEKMNISIFEYM